MGYIQSVRVYGDHTRACVPQGHRADPSGRATDRAVPFGGEMLEGCVQEGESQLGCKVSCRRFAPDSVPKPHPEPERELQNGSQNELKSSQMESLGESWGHLWPTWVPKRLLERQVGAKMGQVGAKMGQDEVKLGPSWGPMGPNWGQVGAKMLPGGAQKAPSGGPRGLFGAFWDHLGAKMRICWNTSVSCMKTNIPAGE